LRESFRHIIDEVLWEQFRGGDEHAFTEIFQRHYRRLLHYGLKFSPDQPFVEDCIQELMIRIWRKQKVVGTTDSVRFYLLKTFRHILFRKLRQYRIFSENTDAGEEGRTHSNAEDRLIEDEASRLLERRVKAMLSQLTPRQQEVLYLRYYQNLSPGEIAGILQINTQSVNNIIHRAFLKIRENTPETSFSSFISNFLLFCL